MSIGSFPISATPIAGLQGKIVNASATLVATSTLTASSTVLHRGSTTLAGGSSLSAKGFVIGNRKPYNFELDAGGLVDWSVVGCVINSISADTKRAVIASDTGTGQVIGSINGQVIETTTFVVSEGVDFGHSTIIRNV